MTCLLRSLAVIPLAALALGAPLVYTQPETPAAVTAAFDQLEQQLKAKPDVSGPLAPGRRELALLMRKYPRAAQAWQLDPSFASSLSDENLFGFVVERANCVLTCGSAILRSRDLREPAASDAAAVGVTPQLWKGSRSAGALRVTLTCTTILDAAGQPALLSKPEDLQTTRALMGQLDTQAAAALAGPTLAPGRLEANLGYLRTQYGSADREPAIERALADGSAVYSRQVLVFTAYVLSSPKVTKPIFLAPLSP